MPSFIWPKQLFFESMPKRPRRRVAIVANRDFKDLYEESFTKPSLPEILQKRLVDEYEGHILAKVKENDEIFIELGG